METWAVQAAIVALFALACAGLVRAWRHGRLGLAAVLLFAAAVSVWALELAAVMTQWRGADGFADCGSYCSAGNYVSAIAFLAPPLLIALSAVGMLVAMGRRIRIRRAREREAVG